MNDETMIDPDAVPLPAGICTSCLHHLAAPTGEGLDFVEIDVAPGLIARAIFCPHTSCGAHMILGRGRAPRWVMSQPITASEFAEELKRLPSAFAVADAHVAAEAAQRAHGAH